MSIVGICYNHSMKGCKMAHYVYFISDGEYLKIGISNDVEKRLKALQTSNARPLKLLDWVLASDRDYAAFIESQLHEMFKEFRLAGEWFNIEAEKAISAGKQLSKKVDTRTIQQRFDSFVEKDLAINYPPITHSAPMFTIKKEYIRSVAFEYRQSALTEIENEIDAIRESIGLLFPSTVKKT